MSKTPAKINRKLATRFAIGIGLLAVMLGAFAYFSYWKQDPAGTSTFDSKAYIAAVQEQGEEGSRVVLLDPQGKVVPSPEYTAGANDRSPVWSPDGNHVFFISDRGEGEPHIFRWSPGAETLERRSVDRRARTLLSFTAPGQTRPSETGLLTTGGAVLEYDPKTTFTTSVLPPGKQQRAEGGDEGGSLTMFEGMYGPLGGQSFKKALWGYQKKLTVAVLKRDDSELLITQAPDRGPEVVGAADRIDFDVDPQTGLIAASTIGFQFPDPDPKSIDPQFIKNGKVVTPFRHRLELADPVAKTRTIVAESEDDRLCFANPVFSPDGSFIAVIVGPYSKTNGFSARVLAIVPAAEAGGAQAKNLVAGNITEVSWHPDGKSLLYSQRDKGKVALWTINTDGTGKREIAGGAFTSASFSPQSE